MPSGLSCDFDFYIFLNLCAGVRNVTRVGLSTG